ncbi:hypothetical protein QFC21_005221 [Naganishia friedmannii]|uniref:Uncharacterized protein n=1 Tax=Naganishia friedmannii TaxID=89922 RepID=A0ACC2VAL7_9TREE|nr:hypothetical protein QFC21_005221 [Naganishia friedmannii]
MTCRTGELTVKSAGSVVDARSTFIQKSIYSTQLSSLTRQIQPTTTAPPLQSAGGRQDSQKEAQLQCCNVTEGDEVDEVDEMNTIDEGNKTHVFTSIDHRRDIFGQLNIMARKTASKGSSLTPVDTIAALVGTSSAPSSPSPISSIRRPSTFSERLAPTPLSSLNLPSLDSSRPLPSQHINKANLVELKNACDDAVKKLAYAYYFEGSKIYIGKRKSLSKRIETEVIRISSRSLPSSASPSLPPRYLLNLSYRRSANKNKSLIRRARQLVEASYGELIDSQGGVEEERIRDWIGAMLVNVVGGSAEEVNPNQEGVVSMSTSPSREKS